MAAMKRMAALAIAGSVAFTACDDADPVDVNGDAQDFTIMMEPAGGMGAALMGPSSPSDGRISLDAVESIVLPIGEVEALHRGSGEWLEAGSIDESVDLMDLPEDGVTLLDSELPEGEYTMLRLWLTDDATITLNEDVTVGRTTFEAGTRALDIPSADQAGVRLHADFMVDADGEVLTILFDDDATVRKVTATGSGVLKIAPVLRVENEDGDDVGGNDDEDDDVDDDDEVEFEGLVSSATAAGFVLDDGTSVVVTDETEIEGDLLSLDAVVEALLGDEAVEAEVEGVLDSDGTTVVASKVEFEVEDDDGDGDLDDDDDGEVEIEGLITAVDRTDMSFDLEYDGGTVTVLLTETTEVESHVEWDSFDGMADAFDAGANVWAEAEGSWASEGVLAAHEVEFEDGDEDDED